MINETWRRYADFLGRNPYLTQATCWTVVQPAASPLSVEAIAERLGGRAEDLESEPDDDVDEADYEAAFDISRDDASLDPVFPGERWGGSPHALDAELTVLEEAASEPGEWQAAAMAVVEAVTGVRLDLPDADAPRLLLEEAIPDDAR